MEKLVNDEDVFVNQLNLDCIIFHSSQTKILLYHYNCQRIKRMLLM